MTAATDHQPRPARRWQIALALAWAVACGLPYARMVLVERLPGVARWLGVGGE